MFLTGELEPCLGSWKGSDIDGNLGLHNWVNGATPTPPGPLPAKTPPEVRKDDPPPRQGREKVGGLGLAE